MSKRVIVRSLIGCATALFVFSGCGGGYGDDAPTPPAVPVIAAPTSLSYTSPANATLNVAITALTPIVVGSVSSYAIKPALPAGLELNTTTGAISGTATVLADTTAYTITASNSTGNATFALSLKVGPPQATPFAQVNLVSNGAIAGVRVDAPLVNPWGLAFGAAGPSWIANNVSNKATLYDGNGVPSPVIVSIPAGTRGAADPTGIVANGSTDFTVSKNGVTAAARFVFAGEGGTLSGWNPTVDATNAILMFEDVNGARYQGLALANGQLFATDFRNRKIDTFDKSFTKVASTGGFADPNLPAGLAPFGIQAVTLGTTQFLIVTYATQSANGNDPVVGAGTGVVNVFDLNGTLVRRLITGGRLNAPWGIAKAPAGFGAFSGLLLIGNLGDGTINAFDPTTGVFAGSIANAAGTALTNTGLRAIAFGNGVNNQPVTTLYFTAGLAAETGGLYGRVDLVP